MSQQITPKQMGILIFIRDYIAEHAYSPTLREIADYFGRSRATIHEHVNDLVRKRLLFKGKKHTSRSLRIAWKTVFPAADSP